MSDTFISRWGAPELDDNRYIHIPGFIIKNWAKFVSIQEWAFIVQIMSFKFDCSDGKAHPSLSTIQEELGYKNIRSVQTIKKALVKRNLLIATERDGQTTEYNFAPFTEKCRAEFHANQNTPLNHNTGEGVNQNTPLPLNQDSPKELEDKTLESKESEIKESSLSTKSLKNPNPSLKKDSSSPSVDEIPSPNPDKNNLEESDDTPAQEPTQEEPAESQEQVESPKANISVQESGDTSKIESQDKVETGDNESSSAISIVDVDPDASEDIQEVVSSTETDVKDVSGTDNSKLSGKVDIADVAQEHIDKTTAYTYKQWKLVVAKSINADLDTKFGNQRTANYIKFFKGTCDFDSKDSKFNAYQCNGEMGGDGILNAPPATLVQIVGYLLWYRNWREPNNKARQANTFLPTGTLTLQERFRQFLADPSYKSWIKTAESKLNALLNGDTKDLDTAERRFDNFSVPKPEDYQLNNGVEYIYD